jgi:uncharacterized protein DUF4386
VLYLVIIVLGLFGEAVVRGRLVVPGDPAGTAARIRAMEPLWRAGLASEFVLLICAIVLLMILYVLLRPVSRDLAMLAVVFNVVSIAVEAATTMPLVEALFPLGRAGYLQAFPSPQLDVMTMLAIRSHDYGFGVALIFFGCFCLIVGRLIFRSGFLPRAIGVLMQLAGACYLADSFALLLSPPLANRLYPYILLPALVGESSLCLWLIVRGVDAAGWEARAARGAV